MTDRELLEQAKRGSEDAFAQLVLDNQNRVYSLALRLTGDREEAADLAQEAFVRAWQGLPGFQGESSFSTWLYRLTTNVCIDYLRRQKRREGVERPAPLEDGEGTRIEPADWSQEPHRQLEQRERSQALDRALDRLPEHHRRPLMLRELSGLSYREIGEALDLDLGTVKSRISRARLSLRKILLEDGNFFDGGPSKPAKGKTRGGEAHGL